MYELLVKGGMVIDPSQNGNFEIQTFFEAPTAREAGQADGQDEYSSYDNSSDYPEGNHILGHSEE